MKVIKAVSFIADPPQLAKEMTALLLKQAGQDGVLDISAAIKLISNHTTVLQETQVISRADLESAVNPKVIVDVVEREIWHDLRAELMEKVTVITVIRHDDDEMS